MDPDGIQQMMTSNIVLEQSFLPVVGREDTE